MCRKCYPITDASDVGQERWHIAGRISEQMYLMCRNLVGGIRYSTLYVHRVCPVAPKGRYEDIDSVSDRLRWLRQNRGLLQSEVAAQIGVTRAVYLDIECGITRHVPAAHFMDSYDEFLREGQGRQIRAIRDSLGMNKKQFARYLGIPIPSLRAWESGEKTISRRCWERYFRNITEGPGV